MFIFYVLQSVIDEFKINNKIMPSVKLIMTNLFNIIQIKKYYCIFYNIYNNIHIKNNNV